jgi:hypothetical protein
MELLRDEMSRELIRAYTSWCRRRPLIIFCYAASILKAAGVSARVRTTHEEKEEEASGLLPQLAMRVLQSEDLLKSIGTYI